MKNILRRLGLAAGVFAAVLLASNTSFTAAQTKKDKPSAAQAAHKRLQENIRSYFADRAAGISYRPKVATPPPPLQIDLALKSKVPFADPPAFHSKDGELVVTLTAQKAKNRIGADPVFLRSYNGNLVGPTLRVRAGDTLKISLKNRLDQDVDPDVVNTMHRFNTANLHTHGFHVSPAGDSDNVLRAIPPGETGEIVIKIPPNHPAGTFWYHSHHHGSVAAQVGSGLSGALIVEGGIDAVPEIAAAADRVFVLQQIPYYIPPGQTEGVIEAPFVDQCFSPGSWKDLQRFTTVNGLQLPVLRMTPGSVERWRLIDTGIHETIHFKLIKVGPGGNLGETLHLHEVAVDGLALGDVEKKHHIEMWPGYRADVLVKAPSEPAEYVIVDERADGNQTIGADLKERNFIGRLIVAGTVKAMALPPGAALAKYRLPSVQPAELTGTQSATYSLVKNPDN